MIVYVVHYPQNIMDDKEDPEFTIGAEFELGRSYLTPGLTPEDAAEKYSEYYLSFFDKDHYEELKNKCNIKVENDTVGSRTFPALWIEFPLLKINIPDNELIDLIHCCMNDDRCKYLKGTIIDISTVWIFGEEITNNEK